MFLAATHNGISRLYETFGNGGHRGDSRSYAQHSGSDANMVQAESAIAASELVASKQQQLPADRTSRLDSATSQTIAGNSSRISGRRANDQSPSRETKAQLLMSFPPTIPDPARRQSFLEFLQKQHVEISRATQAFTALVPAPRPRPANTANADTAAARSTDTLLARPRMESREFPAGSYIVRMDQPYSRIADGLLDYQYWAPSDPQKQPYDDTGWTFP
jgi:hypothetical protein